MAIRILPGYIDQVLAQTLTELAAAEEREEHGLALNVADIVDWGQEHFYITSNLNPIKLMPHQICILRYMFTRREDGKFPASTLIFSTVKKSGKTTVGALIGRWMAETQARYGDIYCCGNDMGQAIEREFTDIKHSIELTPGFDKGKDQLPGVWRLRARTMNCLLNGSRVRAVSVDAKGEAGGAPVLSIWTELWGFDTTEALHFWEEMTPAPTIKDSIRLVETYAGYDDGSSELLWTLYEAGKAGRQLTAGEICSFAARDKPGQTYEELLAGWHEANGDPDTLIPVWHSEQAGVIMYWDEGVVARRMPWQQGEEGERYYREREASEPPAAFRRHHFNEWVGSESAFIDIALWDACAHEHERREWEPIKRIDEDINTPIVVAVDAAVTSDCFGIVAVSRCPHDPTAVDIRGYKKWDPKEEGGVVDFSEPEQFLRDVSKRNNVVKITYDPYQLEDMGQRLRRDFVTWVDPFQQGAPRNQADSQLYDMIIQRRIHHIGQNEIREHVGNANAKLQTDEDSKIRIVKKKNGRKIDLVVATSMAAHQCMYLNLA